MPRGLLLHADLIYNLLLTSHPAYCFPVQTMLFTYSRTPKDNKDARWFILNSVKPICWLSLYWIEYNISIDQDIIPLHPPPFHLFKTPYLTSPGSASLLHSNKSMQLCGISSLISLKISDILSELSLPIIPP